MSGANSNEILEAKEYLVTNGLGGYASSTYKFGNTRKYHGVLVVAESNLQRFNLVNRVLDYLEINKLKYPLSTTIYQNTIETFSNSEY
ncbi:MAG TPA: glycogen debranching enzyme N-terminal domain-containing protein, partial [Candidatus Dojkabacteria bacterium]|nr:glycogen debranching enzyme N-terminal domain-containing protein [Candidatus Dojkabacteria bacterium]